MLRREADYIFQTVHLPNMTLVVDLKLYHPEKEDPDHPGSVGIYLLDNNCHFEHIASYNNDLAIFKLTPFEYLETDISEILRCLCRDLTAAESPFSERVKSELKCQINDTELPSFAFDKQCQEISFNWRGALAYFFAEEKMYNQMMTLRVRRTSCEVV